MTIAEKRINESQFDEVAEFVQARNGVMSFDKDDIKFILTPDKESMLYKAYQEEGVDNMTFMKEFFNELKKKEVVQNCTSLLICIGMSPNDPLMMEDIGIVDDFLKSLQPQKKKNDNLETKWSLQANDEGCRMSLLAICSKNC